MSEHVVELTDADFKEKTAQGVVLVDFYGTWCPPCKLLEPVIEQLAENYAGRAMVAKVNVDDNSEAAVDNSIADIPTVILYKNGEESSRLFGAQKLETLSAELDRLLS